jgi:hypothetical protein
VGKDSVRQRWLRAVKTITTHSSFFGGNVSEEEWKPEDGARHKIIITTDALQDKQGSLKQLTTGRV